MENERITETITVQVSHFREDILRLLFWPITKIVQKKEFPLTQLESDWHRSFSVWHVIQKWIIMSFGGNNISKFTNIQKTANILILMLKKREKMILLTSC